jgi:hypothetical protein
MAGSGAQAGGEMQGKISGPAMTYPVARAEPLLDFQVRLWRLVFSVRCAFLLPIRRSRPVVAPASPGQLLPVSAEEVEHMTKSPRELLREIASADPRRPLDHDLRFHRS